MATTRETIESAIKTALEAATGVQHVYIGHRQYSDPAAFKTAYRESDTTDIQAWFISRTATPQDTAETRPGSVAIRHELLRHYVFQIEGVYSVKADGTSYTAFQALLDLILTAFDNKRTLGGWMAFPVQLQRVDEIEFGNILCHRALFNIQVDTIIQGLSPS